MSDSSGQSPSQVCTNLAKQFGARYAVLTGRAQRNLARIRDNQRRSRARRKEYLQDLETRYRQCEQLGIEASAEIQAAGRRVVDENRRLRALLKQQGLSDAEIDGRPIDAAESPQLTASARALEDKLNARRPCGPGNCGSPATGSSQCGPSAPLAEETPGPAVMARPNSGQHHNSYSHVVSSVPSVSNTVFHPLNVGDSETQDCVPSTQPPANLQEWADFDTAQYFNATSSPPPPLPNLSSCRAAADAIRYYDPSLDSELEATLGCGTCGEDQDCMVPTAQVFEVLNRMRLPSNR